MMMTTWTDKLRISTLVAMALLIFGALFPAYQGKATDKAKAVFGVA